MSAESFGTQTAAASLLSLSFSGGKKKQLPVRQRRDVSDQEDTSEKRTAAPSSARSIGYVSIGKGKTSGSGSASPSPSLASSGGRSYSNGSTSGLTVTASRGSPRLSSSSGSGQSTDRGRPNRAVSATGYVGSPRVGKETGRGTRSSPRSGSEGQSAGQIKKSQVKEVAVRGPSDRLRTKYDEETFRGDSPTF